MQSSKSTKKIKSTSTESLAASEATKPVDAAKATKRVAKPSTTSVPSSEPASVSPKVAAAPRKPLIHRAAKPVTVSAEATPEKPVTNAAIEEAKLVAKPRIITHDDVAKLAYYYWLARGQQGGSPYEDWVRAERELRSSR